MALDFRRGTASEPRGHALAYFDSPGGAIFAIYIVVPPIVFDLMKYVPPMFAGQVPEIARHAAAAIPLPPIPEEFTGGIPALERLAERREDDVIFGGRVDPGALAMALATTSEIANEYGRLYAGVSESAERAAPSAELPLAVDEFLAQFMSETDRVAEVAKLIGKLRYAVDANDEALAVDTVAEIERIGRQLGAKYRLTDLVAAAKSTGSDAARLATLYVDRCYRLAAEEYEAVGRLEDEIRRLSAPESSGSQGN
jgi:hypothetical protein